VNYIIAYPLLQTLPAIREGDARSNLIGGAVFVLFFAILIIAGGRGGTSSGNSGKKVSKRQLRNFAARKGLDKRELSLIQQVASGARTSPVRILQSPAALDSALKRAFNSLDVDPHPGVDKETRKLELYRIKQKLERSGSGGSGTYSSTKQVPLGQQISIQDEGGERFQSKINGNLQKYLSVTVPVDNHGTQIRWKKWTKLKIFFWRPNGQGFSFESKVIGYNMLKGVSSLFIQHTNAIKKEQQRRHRRREINRPAYFYPIKVMITGSGKNLQKKAVVEHKRGTLATVLDISAGGCSLKSNYPIGKGELTKVEFETGKGNHISVYGKIRDMSRTRPIGGIMHVQFTRLSRKHLNRINSYVYGLESGPAKNQSVYN
jgi:hypothetical protein